MHDGKVETSRVAPRDVVMTGLVALFLFALLCSG